MAFSVATTSRFDRELKKLAAKQPQAATLFTRAIEILKADPYNTSRQHPIKKLEAVSPGDAQYRIRSGRFRFRYDVDGPNVILKACSLRREDSYR